MDHVVLKNRRTTLERAQKFISPEIAFFNDDNLYGKVYPEKHPLKSLTHYQAAGRITYEEAIKGVYKPAKVGDKFGPAFSTHWFCVTIEIPAKWLNQEVHLLWDSESEALVWKDGQPITGFSGYNKRINHRLSKNLKANQRQHKFYVEMACNTVFGAGSSLIGPPDPNKQFTLVRAEIACRNDQAFQLFLDFQVINGMAKHLGESSEEGNQAMLTANRMVNQVVADGGSSFTRAKEIGSQFFTRRNAPSQHTIHAVGHCHIDTAWLWSYAETIRKCARSWATTIRLLEEYDFTFACSQAQQYEWVKQHYPGLYAEVTKFVKTGKFLPVGSCWVEMDGNMPSGEAFVRQFLYGQRFFKKEFGVRCKEFWLPDTFGYSGQLPQIMKLFGLDRFLTQKISWNLVNKFPHNTFWWQGIDGSKILTHFPPGDCYDMEVKIEEILKTRNNHSDKGRSDRTMYLFGFGDGGQGPTEEMILRLKRIEDVYGLPKVKLSSPDEYFGAVEREDLGNLCTWSGELYLEIHNGTYTTQAQTKYYNRKCEIWLHELEAVAAIANVLNGGSEGYSYPAEGILEHWKLVLLNQFHDVLPGSSIAEVYTDAVEYYQKVEKFCRDQTGVAFKHLSTKQGVDQRAVFNSQGWDRTELITIPTEGASPARKKAKKTAKVNEQVDKNGNTLMLVRAPSYGVAPANPCSPNSPVSVLKQGDGVVMKNGLVEAHINQSGHLTKLHVTGSLRNGICEKHVGNMFVIYDDMPLFWDAWDVMDYHLETRKPVDKVIQKASIVESGPLRGSIKVAWQISEKSSITQTISLDAHSPYLRFDTQVEWHESHKFLKVEFPTSVKSENATYEIQFGHLQRPTHTNTSWDAAKFEVCSHKWADLSEYGYGVSILNDCKYGFSTASNVMRLSLLKAPKAPDGDADMGTQRFTYAIMPHTGSFQSAGVIQQAYNLNVPLYLGNVKTVSDPRSFFSLDTTQVILETVKRDEDDDNAIVLRLYEAFGGSASVNLSTTLPVRTVLRCDGYEEVLPNTLPLDINSDKSVTISFKPFQLVSLIYKF